MVKKTRKEWEQEVLSSDRYNGAGEIGDIPENKTEILVARRRCGKTTEAIKVAIQKLKDNDRVLFATFTRQAIEAVILPALTLELTKLRVDFNYSRSEKLLRTDLGPIKFVTDDEMKTRGFELKRFEDWYKIYDELLIPRGFDFVTVTGKNYEDETGGTQTTTNSTTIVPSQESDKPSTPKGDR